MTEGKKLALQYCVPQKPRHGLSSSHSMRSLRICPMEIQEESTTIQPIAEGWNPVRILSLFGRKFLTASDSFTTASKKRCQSNPPFTGTFQRLCISILPSKPAESSWWTTEGCCRLWIENRALNGRRQEHWVLQIPSVLKEYNPHSNSKECLTEWSRYGGPTKRNQDLGQDCKSQ